MSRLFYHVMQDNLGNLLFDVSGTMRLAGTGTLATIYGDEAQTVILPNPMTNHPSFASFKCFLAGGYDYDFYMAKAGYTFETLTGVQGYGSMAQQEANAVAITGGSATLATLSLGAPSGSETLSVSGTMGINGQATLYQGLTVDGTPLVVDANNNRVGVGNTGGSQTLTITGTLGVSQTSQFYSGIGLLREPTVGVGLHVDYRKADVYGLILHPSDTDAAGFPAIGFTNLAGTAVGGINATVAATSYNTTSDARLKCAVEPLAGALDVVRALRPVSFLWKADGSPGRGLLAQEVAEVVDGVITGEKDAVDEDGNIQAQMIDYSKLVPYLIGAVKELTQQVEMLQAQVAEAGA